MAALRACDIIVVRDKPSFRISSSLQPSRPIIEAFDLAALLGRSKRISGRHVRRERYLVIAPVSLAQASAYCDALHDDTLWGGVAAAVREALQSDRHLFVRVAQMSASTGLTNDRAVCQYLVSRLAPGNERQVEFVDYDDDPSKNIRTFEESDMVIAARYHAAMFGYLAGARLLLVAYHKKVGDLAKQIGLPSSACICVEEALCFDSVKARTAGLLNEESGHAASLAIPEAEAMALRNISALMALLRSDVHAPEHSAIAGT